MQFIYNLCKVKIKVHTKRQYLKLLLAAFMLAHFHFAECVTNLSFFPTNKRCIICIKNNSAKNLVVILVVHDKKRNIFFMVNVF